MKNRITVEHNGKIYEALPDPPDGLRVCWFCALADECAGQVPCLCSEIVDLRYHFNLIGYVQNNIQSRSADYER